MKILSKLTLGALAAVALVLINGSAAQGQDETGSTAGGGGGSAEGTSSSVVSGSGGSTSTTIYVPAHLMGRGGFGNAAGADGSDKEIADLQSQLDLLKQQRAVLQQTDSDAHPTMMALDARMKAISAMLDALQRKRDDELKRVDELAGFSKASSDKLVKEIADLQGRQADSKNPNARVNPEDQLIPLDDRIKSLQAAADWEKANPGAPRTGLFAFGGGSPADFIREASSQFHLPWLGIVTLPVPDPNTVPDPNIIDVPPFNVFVQQPSDILNMYNELARDDESLGVWQWEGDPGNPDSLMLDVPRARTPNRSGADMKVKAFSVAGIHSTKWDALNNAIEEAAMRAQEYMVRRHETVGGLEGICRIDSDSRVLVAIGQQSYIDMVESMVSSFATNFPPLLDDSTPKPKNF